MKRFEKLFLDVSNGKLYLNDEEIKNVSYFKLEFDGDWSLTITEDFRPLGQKIQKDYFLKKLKNCAISFKAKKKRKKAFSLYATPDGFK